MPRWLLIPDGLVAPTELVPPLIGAIDDEGVECAAVSPRTRLKVASDGDIELAGDVEDKQVDVAATEVVELVMVVVGDELTETENDDGTHGWNRFDM